MDVFTLLEYSKTLAEQGNFEGSAVVDLIAKSETMQALPFMNIGSSSYNYMVDESRPEVKARAINDGIESIGVGVLESRTETLHEVGGLLDVDRRIIEEHGAGRMDFEQSKYSMAIGANYVKRMFKGDSEDGTATNFDGMQKRCDEADTNLFTTGATASGVALSLTFLDSIVTEFKRQSPEMMQSRIYVPYTMRTYLAEAYRKGLVGSLNINGYQQYGLLGVGNEIYEYAGLPIILVGNDESGSPILDFNEIDGAATNSDTGSIYLASHDEDGFIGLINGGINIRDIGYTYKKLANGKEQPVYRKDISFIAGAKCENKKRIMRINHIKKASITE